MSTACGNFETKRFEVTAGFFCQSDGAIVKNKPIRCAFVKIGLAMMFERKIFQEMRKWKEQHAPHYALFLKGARRVGKTTLAEKLGREA